MVYVPRTHVEGEAGVGAGPRVVVAGRGTYGAGFATLAEHQAPLHCWHCAALPPHQSPTTAQSLAPQVPHLSAADLDHKQQGEFVGSGAGVGGGTGVGARVVWRGAGAGEDAGAAVGEHQTPLHCWHCAAFLPHQSPPRAQSFAPQVPHLFVLELDHKQQGERAVDAPPSNLSCTIGGAVDVTSGPEGTAGEVSSHQWAWQKPSQRPLSLPHHSLNQGTCIQFAHRSPMWRLWRDVLKQHLLVVSASSWTDPWITLCM